MKNVIIVLLFFNLKLIAQTKVPQNLIKNPSFEKKKNISTLLSNGINRKKYFGIGFLPQLVWLTPDLSLRNPGLGYSTGLIFQHEINNRFSLEADLMFSFQPGHSFCLNGYEGYCSEPVTEQWYFFQVPLMLHYRPFRMNDIYLIGGLQGNYFFRNITPSPRRYNTLNYYGLTGIGIHKKFTRNFYFTSQLRLEYNFTDARPGGSRYNNFKSGVMIGILWGD